MDKNLAIYAHFQTDDPAIYLAAKPRLDFLVKLIRKRSSGVPHVLNIGVGDGYLERQCKSRGWHAHAVDPIEEALEPLRRDGIDARVGVVEQLPYADGSMDFVVISEVIEHLTKEQIETGLSEIVRVLKPAGRVVGTVPHAEELSASTDKCPDCGAVFHRYGHQQSFTLAKMTKVLSSHFVVERVSRTAFVALDFDPLRFLKSSARIVLGKLGEPIASPNIWWVARKS